jgi:hypothetical protein
MRTVRFAVALAGLVLATEVHAQAEATEAAAGSADAATATAAAPTRATAATAAEVAALGPAVVTSPTAARAPAAAIDRIDLGATSITGNQELPKVLYIVPWKRSDLGDLTGRPVNTLLDEVLAPIDPEVFERQLSYYETLHGQSQKE